MTAQYMGLAPRQGGNYYERCEGCGDDFVFRGDGFVCEECKALPVINFCPECGGYANSREERDTVAAWERTHRGYWPEQRSNYDVVCAEHRIWAGVA